MAIDFIITDKDESLDTTLEMVGNPASVALRQAGYLLNNAFDQYPVGSQGEKVSESEKLNTKDHQGVVANKSQNRQQLIKEIEKQLEIAKENLKNSTLKSTSLVSDNPADLMKQLSGMNGNGVITAVPSDGGEDQGGGRQAPVPLEGILAKYKAAVKEVQTSEYKDLANKASETDANFKMMMGMVGANEQGTSEFGGGGMAGAPGKLGNFGAGVSIPGISSGLGIPSSLAAGNIMGGMAGVAGDLKSLGIADGMKSMVPTNFTKDALKNVISSANPLGGGLGALQGAKNIAGGLTNAAQKIQQQVGMSLNQVNGAVGNSGGFFDVVSKAIGQVTGAIDKIQTKISGIKGIPQAIGGAFGGILSDGVGGFAGDDLSQIFNKLPGNASGLLVAGKDIPSELMKKIPEKARKIIEKIGEGTVLNLVDTDNIFSKDIVNPKKILGIVGSVPDGASIIKSEGAGAVLNKISQGKLGEFSGELSDKIGRQIAGGVAGKLGAVYSKGLDSNIQSKVNRMMQSRINDVLVANKNPISGDIDLNFDSLAGMVKDNMDFIVNKNVKKVLSDGAISRGMSDISEPISRISDTLDKKLTERMNKLSGPAFEKAKDIMNLKANLKQGNLFDKLGEKNLMSMFAKDFIPKGSMKVKFDKGSAASQVNKLFSELKSQYPNVKNFKFNILSEEAVGDLKGNLGDNSGAVAAQKEEKGTDIKPSQKTTVVKTSDGATITVTGNMTVTTGGPGPDLSWEDKIQKGKVT